MGLGFALDIPIHTIPVDALNRPERLPLNAGHDVAEGGRSLADGEVVGQRFQGRAGRVLCDFDLDLTLVSFTRKTLTLLLGGIVRLCRSWRSTFQAAVPVVGREGLALVLLC